MDQQDSSNDQRSRYDITVGDLKDVTGLAVGRNASVNVKKIIYNFANGTTPAAAIADIDKVIARHQKKLIAYENALALEDDPDERERVQERLEGIKEELRDYRTAKTTLREAINRGAEKKQQPRRSVLVTNYPYGLEGHFVGREDETRQLNDWFHNEPDFPMLAVIGLGGMGKSALTWRWMQQLQKEKLAPPIVVWWSFYETDGTLHKMLIGILRYLGARFEEGWTLRQLYDTFCYVAANQPMLIILDGAERLLRAYGSMGAAYQGDGDDPAVTTAPALRDRVRECIDPVADTLLRWLTQPNLQSKTLLTSRLMPSSLQGQFGLLAGVRRHDLTGLSQAAAVDLFKRMKIEGTAAEVRAACQPLGYHPLSLRLLASWLADDPSGAADIRKAAQYDPTLGLLGRRTHVLERVYDGLPTEAQTLLGQMAALRSTVDWALLKQAFNTQRGTLALLVRQGLVQESVITRRKLFDLHPIVRRYAYGRLSDRTATHAQLVTAFEAVPAVERVKTLADLRPTIELYHHLASAGEFDRAFELFRDRLHSPLYYQLGAYQTCIDLLRLLFVDGEDALPRLTREGDQAWTLGALANSYSLSGRPKAMIPLLAQCNAIRERQSDKKNLAIGLGAVASAGYLPIGRFQPATNNLRRRITLCREIEDRFREAVGHKELGRTLAHSGAYDEAETAFAEALQLDSEDNKIQGQGITWAYRAEAVLLRGRAQDAPTAREAAQQARHFAEETARTHYPFERDFVQCYWLLGWSALAMAQLPDQALPASMTRAELLTESRRELDTALRRCRAINSVDMEVKTLLAQARLARFEKRVDDAKICLADAQRIAKRSGYVPDLADIHNEFALLARDAGDRRAALDHAQQARDYAWCDGPPFAYQSALDRANKLLTTPP